MFDIANNLAHSACMDASFLATELRRTRESQHLSLTEVASRAQISKAYLSQLEHGASKQPSFEVLARLATALGASVEDLTGRTTVWDPTELAASVPSSLRSFAAKSALPESDIAMLSRIHYRGKQPKEADDWAHIYETIKRTVG